MKIIWQIDVEDVAQVKEFLDRQRENAYVRKRMETNLPAEKPPVTKEKFWYTMVGCLLTTQQRSGPNSPVSSDSVRRAASCPAFWTPPSSRASMGTS